MSLAIIKSPAEMRVAQQRMIRACERSGIRRQNLAAIFEVDESYIGHIMDGGTFIGGARFYDGLLQITSHLDEDQFIESLLDPRKCVTMIHDVTTDGSYLDELLDGQELLGDTTRHVRRDDHSKVRDFFRRLKAVCIRGEMEAALRLREA